MEQAASDQQTAEGNLRAARDAVRLFGKTDADIDRIIANAAPTRRSSCRARSPAGSRRAMRRRACSCSRAMRRRPTPSPISTPCGCWPNVAEADSPAFRVGQQVQVKVDAFPGRVFDGKITTIGATVDPNTRRVLVRSEVNDPQHELRSGMFANFVISVGAPVRSPGDSGSTAWCAKATAR